MRTLNRALRRSLRRSVPARLPALLTALILTACATPTAPPPVRTGQGQIKPLACTEFPPMTYSTGKPGVVMADIDLDLKRPENPLGYVRADVGDTMTTRAQIDAYQAARAALGC